jgi:hypothetical protein
MCVVGGLATKNENYFYYITICITSYIMSAGYNYVVTEFGCNSSGHCMWTPRSRVFTIYEDAYKNFLAVSPSLDDDENRATRQAISTTDCDARIANKEDYIVIETRVHTPGYLDGDGTCAKRPRGAVIAAIRIL